MKKYEDIINTEWPKESTRPRMPLNQRAKIFLPFAALTGYDKALDNVLQAEIQTMEDQKGSIQFDDIHED